METRQFKVHPRLLFDVIRSQAGTLGKAILEGVMNAVDAKATRVDLVVDMDRVTIVDDGHGFRDRRSIEEFFEVFGQPQTEKKRFGTFRMGRGQLFAYGYNDWRSGLFRMLVDVANRGLDYTLETLPTPAPGCEISVRLYDPLDRRGQLEVVGELTRMIQYLDVPVYLDGVQRNRPPAKEKWTAEDEVAYYRLNDNGSLAVYNLGVLVRSYPAATYGLGGVVVSKEQLKVNFARNDVMSACPVWRKITAAVRDAAGRKIRRSTTLTDAQREHISRQITAGLESDYDKLPLFTDVSGKHWSLQRMLASLYRYRDALTMATHQDLKGDKLMGLKLAFVLSDKTLSRFDVATVDDLLDRVIQPYLGSRPRPQVADFETLAVRLDDHCEVLSEADWRPLEKAALNIYASAASRFADARRRSNAPQQGVRRLVVGLSEAADGWTDGSSYIAINRSFLAKLALDVRGFVEVGVLLAHEYCHDDPSSATHAHSPEFYEAFHDLITEHLPEFVSQCLYVAETYLKTEKRRSARATLKSLDKEAAIKKAAAAVRTAGS